MEIDKGTVAHDTLEGVEGYEGDPEHNEADHKSEDERPEVLCERQASVFEVVHAKAGHEDCTTVKREDAPVW